MGDVARAAGQRPFWESPLLWWALAALSLTPFLVTTILPFNDLPNHVGRHYVFVNAAHDPFLRRFYHVHWALIGNLGIDLIVRALGPCFGAEAATHIAVAAIPPLTIAGIYSLSRAVNGSVQPSALVATPLVLNWPLVTGLANFCLSAALALLVLALWIRLRGLRFAARFVIFLPLAFATWVAHAAGWGLLGLGVLSYEISRATRPRFRLPALLLAPVQTLPFAAMFVVTILWRRATSTGAAIHLGPGFLQGKALAIASLMRERFMLWDLASTLIFAGLILYFYWRCGRRLVSPALAIAVGFALAFLLCPQEVFQSGFADRRLLTYAAIMAPLAIGVAPGWLDDPRRRRAIMIGAIASLALFGSRIAVSSIVWARASRAHESRLALIDLVPRNSRIFGLVVGACHPSWARIGRPDHIQQYAIVRRNDMINGMYQNSGLNQVQVLFARHQGFNPNMYAMVHDEHCPVPYIPETLQSAMLHFDHAQYDYVWIVGERPLPAFSTQGLTLLAAKGDDRLYRIDDGSPLAR